MISGCKSWKLDVLLSIPLGPDCNPLGPDCRLLRDPSVNNEPVARLLSSSDGVMFMLPKPVHSQPSQRSKQPQTCWGVLPHRYAGRGPFVLTLICQAGMYDP